MDTLLRDIRYGFRSLLKRPVFTTVAVITLALGIGANTSIFSVVNAVLLRPLPYADPDRLVMVFETNLGKGLSQATVSPPNFVDWQNRNRVFEQAAAFSASAFNLSGETEPERLAGARVSANLFSLLRVSPVVGSGFSNDDDQPGRRPVVILSYGLWQRRFGGQREVVGRTLRLNDKSYTIVGVMPVDFQFPARTELWTPIAFDANELQNRGTHFVNVIARLKPGITSQQAETEIDALAHNLQQEHPESNSGWGAKVTPLLEVSVHNIRPALILLFIAAAVVLLIACTNLASLLLARANSRRREIAIRSALGASRLRVIQQLLTESLLLALVGGGLGLLMAFWCVSLIVSINRAAIPRASQIGIDARVLAFTVAISLLTGVVFGLLPAFYASRTDLIRSLKDGGNRSLGRSRRSRGGFLVIAEFALSLVLLIAAGLLLRSFVSVRGIDTGFVPQNLLTFQVILPRDKYREGTRQTAFMDQALQRVASLPGISAAGVTTTLPFVGENINGFLIDGRPEVKASEAPTAHYYAVSDDYFRAIGIPLIRGRFFTNQDGPDAQRVVIINQTLANRFFANEDPIGKRMRITDRTTTMREIVGVVGDVRQYGLEGTVTAQMYEPYAQNPLPFSTFVVRATKDPTTLAGPIRSQIYAVDHDQPVANLRTMEQIVNDSISSRRLSMVLLEVFAAIALALAAVGLYGVLSYAVTERKQEIGIRMALGARGFDVLKLIMRSGMTLALLGLAIGVALAFALTRLMTTLLFGVTPTDATTFAAVSAVLIVVALLACYVPARRATKVDPLVALRYE